MSVLAELTYCHWVSPEWDGKERDWCLLMCATIVSSRMLVILNVVGTFTATWQPHHYFIWASNALQGWKFSVLSDMWNVFYDCILSSGSIWIHCVVDSGSLQQQFTSSGLTTVNFHLEHVTKWWVTSGGIFQQDFVFWWLCMLCPQHSHLC